MLRKALAAAAMTALASAAQAQSNVTVYGVIDLAITKGNGGTANSPGSNTTNKAWIEKQSTSSRLGFRGSEDLGGGLYAEFVLDHRFTPDDGAAATPYWRGKSLVTLRSTRWGAVSLGRDYIPAFFVAVKSDPFGWDGVGQIAIHQFGGYRSTSSTQVNNAVYYRTPNLSGFQGTAMVSLGEGVAARATGLALEYGRNGWYLGLGGERLSGGSTASDGNQLINAAVHYDFGWVKPIVYAAQSKVGATGATDRQYMLGAVFTVGVSRIKAAISRYNPAGANNDQQKIGVGYEYYLSKRTNLYTDAGFAREDRKTDNRAVAVGVRHTF